jgi:putative transposase
MAIYLDDRDRRRFLDLLGQTVISHDVNCHAYCLMTNHYHAVITTNEPNLSHAMQRLNGVYAQWWSRRHRTPGHVFQGRFGAQVIQTEQYLLTACRYVVLNPVRAGLVTAPAQWPWSSYHASAGLEPIPAFLRPDILWHLLGNHGSEEVGVGRYRAFVEEGSSGHLVLPRDRVLGDEGFVQRFKDRRGEASCEVPKRERLARRSLAEYFAGAFTRAGRAASASAACSAGYALTEVAAFMGLHYSTVSKMISWHAALGSEP